MDELNQMILVDEDGNEVTYTFINTIRYKKKEYDFYLPEGKDEIEIFEVGKETDEGVEYLDIDEKLYKILMDMYQSEGGQ